ncbi:MAG TPA: uracil-DNA glycosylase [Chthoniobacterales bacterium]|nr:uracil-DNA glycosylase [Chthoniobacterales bacterium]
MNRPYPSNHLPIRAKLHSMPVMQFPQALEAVLRTLERMRDETAHRPCASRSALGALKQISPSPKIDIMEEHAPASPKNDLGTDPPSRGYGAASSAAPSKADKIDKLAAVQERVRPCTKCPNLASSRTQTVFGVGNPDADIMFVGEAPGADEDAQGEPFVGRAGQLLTKIIKAMGFARGQVYIANILKCRPDVPAGSFGNRPPTPREMQTCRPYLMEQIDIIKPKVIVALGAVAVEGLLGTRAPMRELRGRWDSFNGTPLMITYHPAYLLRNQSPSEKRKVWEDMMQVLERLEKPISEKQRSYFL